MGTNRRLEILFALLVCLFSARMAYAPVGCGAPIPPNSGYQVTPSSLTFNITAGTSSMQTITINPAPPFLIYSVGPNQAQQGASGNLTISAQGTHFADASQIGLGPGVTISSVVASGGSHLSAHFDIADTAAVGTRTVTVTTGTEVVSLANGFSVKAGTPTII